MGPTHDAVCAADLLEARQAHAQPSRSLLRWKLPETHAHSRKHRSIRFVRPHCLQARWCDALRRACTHPRRRAKLEQKPGWRGPHTGIDRQHVVPVLAPARVGRADRGAQRASGGAHTVRFQCALTRKRGRDGATLTWRQACSCAADMCFAGLGSTLVSGPGAAAADVVIARWLPDCSLASLPKMEVEPTRRRRSARPKVTENSPQSQFHLDLRGQSSL